MASAKCIKKLEFYIYFKMESLCDMCAAMSISLKEPNDNIPVDHPSQETRLYYVVRRGGMHGLEAVERGILRKQFLEAIRVMKLEYYVQISYSFEFFYIFVGS
jgi:hypothetical protein